MKGQPRRAAPGALKRWAKESLELIARNPLPYGVLLAALLMADRVVAALLDVQDGAVELVAAPALIATAPLLAAIGFLTARAADRGNARKVFGNLPPAVRRLITGGALLATPIILLTAMLVLFAVLIGSFGLEWPAALTNDPSPPPPLASQSPFLDTAGSFIALLFFLDLGFAPAIVTQTPLSIGEAMEWSREGMRANAGPTRFRDFLGRMIFLALYMQMPELPDYGFIEAVSVILMTTMLYVAYREIYEGESGNRKRQTVQVLKPAHEAG